MNSSEIKFVVQPSIETSVTVSNKNKIISLHDIRITNVLIVLENPIIEGILRNEILVVEPHRQNSISKIDFENLSYDDIYSYGVFDTEKDLVFDTYEFALNKAMDLCAKYKIEEDFIDYFSSNLITKTNYKKRLKYLFENNPELFI